MVRGRQSFAVEAGRNFRELELAGELELAHFDRFDSGCHRRLAEAPAHRPLVRLEGRGVPQRADAVTARGGDGGIVAAVVDQEGSARQQVGQRLRAGEGGRRLCLED